MSAACPTLAIGADGTVTLGNGSAPLASPAELSALLAALPSGSAFEIRADAEARHALVVEVLHGLREAGFLDVSLVATQLAPGADHGGWGGEPR